MTGAGTPLGPRLRERSRDERPLVMTTCYDALFAGICAESGVDLLLARCSELTSTAEFAAQLRIPHDRYDIVAKLHSTGGIVEERAEDDAVYITGRVPFALRDLVAPFLVE